MVVLERKMDIYCEQRPDDGGTGKEDGHDSLRRWRGTIHDRCYGPG